MKNNILRGVLIVMACMLAMNILSGDAFAGYNTASADKVRDDFNKAFNAENAASIAILIDHDGVWMPPGHPTVIGKDNVVAYYTAYFQKMNSTIELKPGDTWMCGKWAFLSGDFIRMDTPKSGGGTSRITGHYLLALRKQMNGAWKIARDIWNDTGVTPKS